MLEPESGREPENLQRKIHPVRILPRPGPVTARQSRFLTLTEMRAYPGESASYPPEQTESQLWRPESPCPDTASAGNQTERYNFDALKEEEWTE